MLFTVRFETHQKDIRGHIGICKRYNISVLLPPYFLSIVLRTFATRIQDFLPPSLICYISILVTNTMLSKIRQACSKVIFSRRKQASSPEPEDTVPTLEQTSCRHYKHLPKELKDPEEKGWASFTKTGLKEEIESQLSNNEVDNVKAREYLIQRMHAHDI